MFVDQVSDLSSSKKIDGVFELSALLGRLVPRSSTDVIGRLGQ